MRDRRVFDPRQASIPSDPGTRPAKERCESSSSTGREQFLAARAALFSPDPANCDVEVVAVDPGALMDVQDKARAVAALTLEIDGLAWSRREHLHRSRPFDRHFVVSSDESGAAWLHFGDDRRGRAVIVERDPTQAEQADAAVERATAVALGGVFDTVLVLIDELSATGVVALRRAHRAAVPGPQLAD